MTNYDLSTIRNAAQLQQLVKDRPGVSDKLAVDDVRSWTLGRDYTTSPPSFVPSREATESISRWDNEGGAARKGINAGYA